MTVFSRFSENCMHSKKSLTAADLADIKSKILALQDMPVLELEFDPGELDIDLARYESPPGLSRTRCTPAVSEKATIKVSIRIPAQVLAAFKAKAVKTGTGYQTEINKTLNAAVLGWGSI